VTALEGARGGAVAEGSVGGGTGMICHEFKGGIGTASRRLPTTLGGHTVGVLVQANHGIRGQLTIAGVPVGREIGGGTRKSASLEARGPAAASAGETGSIIIIVATDAPLLPHQLKRLARRAALGLARTGSISGNGSGDLFLAFSTANLAAARAETSPGELNSQPSAVQALTNGAMTPLFESTVEAVEEAIINALVAGETMTGRDDHVVEGLPVARVQEILKKYNRSAPTP
jgi:D-aminopeptidase